MTERGPRAGAPRDVPPPRPVPAAAPRGAGGGPGSATGTVDDGGGLGRAARAVADAVAGLLGNAAERPGDADPRAGAGDARWSAAAGLRDVIGGLAGAVGSWRGAREADGAQGGGGDGDGAGSAVGDSAGSGTGGRGPGHLLGDLLAAAAPRLPIRDAARLRRAYPGATDEEIADALVARSARLTAAIGAATGGLFAAQWFATPSLLVLPLELGAETVLVAAVEIVLIGELHELHGRPAGADGQSRAAAYLAAWSSQRAVDDTTSPSLAVLLGGAGMRALQRRITRRLTRGIPTAAPFLIGAALAGRNNRKVTEGLARRVRTDLRRRGPSGTPG